jgi:SEC-C motif-containing protein
MNQDSLCPCGSEKNFDVCCGPYLAGAAIPPTAEALMRSRYTAYARLDDKYLLATWHPDTRPSNPNPSDEGDGNVWTGLNILRTEAGQPGDTTGVVEFIAHCEFNDAPSQLHEISDFTHDGERWFYVDGRGQQPIRRESPKVGRNEPCPCGSGKKFKKCCGAN